MKTHCLAAASLTLFAGAVAAAPVISGAVEPPSACLQYDSKSTKLSGTLLTRTYYGPPGYGESPAQDAREGAWLLLLDAPICVAASAQPEKDNNSFERDQIVVQLAAVHIDPKKIRTMQGQRLTATGQLFHAMTGHHRTPVLLDVYGIDAH